MTQKYNLLISEDEIKNRMVGFKVNYPEELKKEVIENKMLLSYDDRTNAFYIFSNFKTQYGIYINESDSGTLLTVFKINKDVEKCATNYLKCMLNYIGASS